MPYRCVLLVFILIFAGCRSREPFVIPTLSNPQAAATSIVQTQNAPPPGFDSIAFPEIDANLTALPGWRYEMSMRFDGVFARTPRQTSANANAEVSYNQLASARRVVADLDIAFNEDGQGRQYEAVKHGSDTFLVQEGICQDNAGESANVAVGLSAGNLLGGVQTAQTMAQRAIINGEEVWRYDFSEENLILPNISFGDGSQILSLTGELWVAPEHNVVIRYYATLEVENVTLFGSNLPVTGMIRIRYDVFDIGEAPNLTVPFGC